MLTQKTNEVADEIGAATFVRARPAAAAVSQKIGFEILERIDFDLGNYGAEVEKTSCWAMRREPGAKSDNGATL
jgi:hypothetical protein